MTVTSILFVTVSVNKILEKYLPTYLNKKLSWENENYTQMHDSIENIAKFLFVSSVFVRVATQRVT